MKIKKLVLAALALALVLSVLPVSEALAAEQLVRFTVNNRGDRGITVRLYSQDGSGRAYYMHIEAGTTKIMTPIAGVYDYRLTACGIMLTGVVDLTRNQTWVNPDCGVKSGAGSKESNTQDVGTILKLVDVKIVNDTGKILTIWFKGPFSYVFVIPLDGTKSVTIPKGFYTWGHFACEGIYQTGNLYAEFGKTKVIGCK